MGHRAALETQRLSATTSASIEIGDYWSHATIGQGSIETSLEFLYTVRDVPTLDFFYLHVLRNACTPMVRTASTMLPLGTVAPPFRLPDVDGKLVSLNDFVGKKGLVVIFMCNHCPFVKHVAPEIVRVSKDYQAQGIGFVGISSNDVEHYPEDAPDKMKQEAAMQGYSFPYLYDADQSIAKAYRAACTPDFFVFNAEFQLVYRGQLDDSRPKSDRPLNGQDLRSALDQLIAGQAVSGDQKPSIGCNIKWKQGAEPEYFAPSGS